jgi:formylglycine-generating enzyme required for sulfatase activity
MKMKRFCLLAGLLCASLLLVSCNDDGPTEPTNHAPVIASLIATPASVDFGDVSSVACTASDADGDALTYAWTSTGGSIAGTGATVAWTAPDAVGVQTLTCTVGDGDDTTSDTVEITVSEPVTPGAMVLVTGGTFAMGDAYAEGAGDELPVHSVAVSDFSLGKYEVTQAEWDAYMTASTYDFGAGDTHPVYYASWFRILMYCNYRSSDEGLTPCYSIGGSTDPDAWGAVPNYASDPTFPAWNAVLCDWDANGYRLPTEAEWEYAARGGVHNADNYRYSGGQTLGDVAWYGDNAPVASEAVGGRLPNQLGLYDMSGNLYEFCWDWYGEGYYAACNALGTVTDPLGAASGDMRVVRGGDWSGVAANCRVAGRFRDYPVSGFSHTGFRVARGH